MTVLGVVLATYNEVENLPTLVHALEHLSKNKGTSKPTLEQIWVEIEGFRIIVVDDNSPDGTSQVGQALADRYGNITIITRPRLLGLGSALRAGMEEALRIGCQYIVTMDADLSHDAGDVPRLFELVRNSGADMVQASRYIEGGSIVGWNMIRKLQSRLANLLYHLLLGTPKEVTTNFRAFNRTLGELVVRKNRSEGFEFQPECTLIAMHHGLSIVETPIIFNDRTLGKSKLTLLQTLNYISFFLVTLVVFRLRIGRFSRSNSKTIEDFDA